MVSFLYGHVRWPTIIFEQSTETPGLWGLNFKQRYKYAGKCILEYYLADKGRLQAQNALSY